jgi:hypothetical protein
VETRRIRGFIRKERPSVFVAPPGRHRGPQQGVGLVRMYDALSGCKRGARGSSARPVPVRVQREGSGISAES